MSEDTLRLIEVFGNAAAGLGALVAIAVLVSGAIKRMRKRAKKRVRKHAKRR